MNLSDPDEKFLQDLHLLLYKFLWDGKHGKRSEVWNVKPTKLGLM